MNLIELSEKLNMPVPALKSDILERFSVIVLSEYAPLQERIAAYYASAPKPAVHAAQKPAAKPARRVEKKPAARPVQQADRFPAPTPADPAPDGDILQCLAALTSVQNAELEYTKKLLAYCFRRRFLIIVDTCSLMNENFGDFYRLFLSVKTREDQVIIVPYVVREELKRIVRENKKEQDVVDSAAAALRFADAEIAKRNMIEVGDENDKRTNERGQKVIHADRVIIEKLIYFRNDSRSTLLITQDHDATVDALRQNDWQSTRSNALILVKKVSKGGALTDNTKETVNPPLPIDQPQERTCDI